MESVWNAILTEIRLFKVVGGGMILTSFSLKMLVVFVFDVFICVNRTPYILTNLKEIKPGFFLFLKTKLSWNFSHQCTQLKLVLVPVSARNLGKSYLGIFEKTPYIYRFPFSPQYGVQARFDLELFFLRPKTMKNSKKELHTTKNCCLAKKIIISLGTCLTKVRVLNVFEIITVFLFFCFQKVELF